MEGEDTVMARPAVTTVKWLGASFYLRDLCPGQRAESQHGSVSRRGGKVPEASGDGGTGPGKAIAGFGGSESSAVQGKGKVKCHWKGKVYLGWLKDSPLL